MAAITNINVPKIAVRERANVLFHNAANLPHQYRPAVLEALSKAASLDSEVDVICETQAQAQTLVRVLNPDFRIAVESESREDISHVVSGIRVDGRSVAIACTCEDFLFRSAVMTEHRCKHLAMVDAQFAIAETGYMLGER